MIATGVYIAIWVIFLTLATASLIARFYVRFRVLARRIDWDDGFIILAYFFMWGEEACLMQIVPALDSIFSSNYTVSTLSDLRKWMWIQFFTFTATCWVIKFSLLAFYARFFYFAMKRTIWITAVFLVLSLITVLLVSSLHCIPAEKFWTPTFVDVDGVQELVFSCSDDHTTAVVNTVGAVLSIVSDIIILAIPIFRVLKLRLAKKQKLALIAVFAVGFLVAAIEVVRCAWILSSGSTLDSVPLNIIWITLQCTLGIVATNLPILRPLFFRRAITSGSGSGEGYTNTSRGGTGNWSRKSKGAIMLYEVPDYVGHKASVSAREDDLERSQSGSGILKSVEVRVDSEILGGSVCESSNTSDSYMPA